MTFTYLDALLLCNIFSKKLLCPDPSVHVIILLQKGFSKKFIYSSYWCINMLLVVLEVPFLVQNFLTVLLESSICRLGSHTSKKAALNTSEYAVPRLPVIVFPVQLELHVSHLLKMHHLHPVVLCIVNRAALRCSKMAVNMCELA